MRVLKIYKIMKMGLQEVGYEGTDWIGLAHD
jgi:hypothetical protein